MTEKEETEKEETEKVANAVIETHIQIYTELEGEICALHAIQKGGWSKEYLNCKRKSSVLTPRLFLTQKI